MSLVFWGSFLRAYWEGKAHRVVRSDTVASPRGGGGDEDGAEDGADFLDTCSHLCDLCGLPSNCMSSVFSQPRFPRRKPRSQQFRSVPEAAWLVDGAPRAVRRWAQLSQQKLWFAIGPRSVLVGVWGLQWFSLSAEGPCQEPLLPPDPPCAQKFLKPCLLPSVVWPLLCFMACLLLSRSFPLPCFRPGIPSCRPQEGSSGISASSPLALWPRKAKM